MEKDSKHKGVTWELKTRVSNQTFDNFDFSNTNFNSSNFHNVNFINCLFFKSNLKGSKLFYESNFDSCRFEGIDLSNSTFGSHKGTYTKCIFEKCEFKGKEFNFTEFIDCDFIKTKFKKVNFNGSKFENCRFSGKFDDVTFNGIYDTNASKTECLKNVDFSEAIFGEFVNFYNCDLSTCIPPKGTSFDELLYQLYSNDPSVLSTGSKDKIVMVRHS